MRFILTAALIGCLALTTSAHAFLTSATYSGAPSCAQGSAYADGCTQAVAAQTAFPTALSTTLTPPGASAPYATRPPWNVAGVDYAVGTTSLTTSLADPTTANWSGTGCSYASFTLTCSGSTPITISGYDFGLHNGVTLVDTAANLTVTNSHFLVGNNQCATPGSCGANTFVANSGAGNITLTNDEFDGVNIQTTNQAGCLICVNGMSGIFTARYNYFHNPGEDMIDFGSGQQRGTIQYNVFKDIGTENTHSDALQWYNSQATSTDISFNFYYDTFSSTSTGGGGNGLAMLYSDGPTGTFTNSLNHNNTIVVLSVNQTADWGNGYTSEIGDGTAANAGQNIAVFDNWIDPSGLDEQWGNTIGHGPKGSWFGVAGEANDFAHPQIAHGLQGMVVNAIIAPYVGSGVSNTSPDGTGYTPSAGDYYTITPSPATGTETPSSAITFTFALAENWTISGGTPTLSLNSGGTATYSSGSGTNSIVFSYTVGSGDTTSGGALSITAFNLNGATIKDGYGNSFVSTGISGTSFSGLIVGPLSITNVVATPGTTTVTVTWTTNNPASSVLNYGLTTSYGSNVNNSSLVTSHSLTATGLSTTTQYHFDVSSTDASSNTATAPDQEFSTK